MEDSSSTYLLTDYERQRKPLEVIEDLTMDIDCLSEFQCTICLELLNETLITKNCFHRFCRECITTAIRKGNKECPVCREKLLSKRDLRPDTEFDEMLKIFFPDREEFDEKSQKIVYNVLAEKFTNCLNMTSKTRKKKDESNVEMEIHLLPRGPDESGSDDISEQQERHVHVPKISSVFHIAKYLVQVPTFDASGSESQETESSSQINIYTYNESTRVYTRIPDHFIVGQLLPQDEFLLTLYYQRVIDPDDLMSYPE